MDGAALLLLPSGLEIDRICALSTVLTVSVTSLLPTSICPLCGAGATRIHSRYHRTVADVACGGRQVRLLLTVRKFFCDTPECARKIFTERLAPFIEPWARMTTRLAHALQSIGLATSGEAGTRLAQRLGIQTSPTTVLRHIMEVPDPVTPSADVVGVDEWALRRGRRYGTILVDGSHHRILDLLPARDAEKPLQENSTNRSQKSWKKSRGRGRKDLLPAKSRSIERAGEDSSA